jgi:hypothetical protein
MLRNAGEEDKEVTNGGTGCQGDARVSGLATVLLQEYDADSLKEGDKVPTCSLRARKLPPCDPIPHSARRMSLGELRRLRMYAFPAPACGIFLYISAGSVGMHTRARTLSYRPFLLLFLALRAQQMTLLGWTSACHVNKGAAEQEERRGQGGVGVGGSAKDTQATLVGHFRVTRIQYDRASRRHPLPLSPFTFPCHVPLAHSPFPLLRWPLSPVASACAATR